MSLERPRYLQWPWRSRRAIARDVDAELSFHIEMRIRELAALGVAPDEATRRAREEFGNLEYTRAYCRALDQRTERAARTRQALAECWQDVRYAARTLRRSPGFAATALLTIALAIGANTAIFSVARAVLLAPLPYRDPGSLVAVFENWPGNPGGRTPLSPANFVDYRAEQHTFTGLAAYENTAPLTWQPDHGDPESLTALAIGPELLHVLGVGALHGRIFAPGDEAPGNDHSVVASYDFWQRALGGDSAMIGRGLTLNGESYRLIGVMPRGFTLGDNEDLWIPLNLGDALADVVRARKQHYVHVVGRLKPGTPLELARADLGTIARRLERQYPEANTGRTAVLVPLHTVMAGSLRAALLLLQGAAAMVLLIACANLANLTLSRTMGRRREMALRAALGAGRGRLVRQLLSESVLLAMLGGALGAALAVAATHALLALDPDALPAIFSARVDGRVLLFSGILSVAAGLLFGLLPGLDAARATLQDALREGGRGASGGRAGERVRRTLVVAQVGLAVMLLIGAGLLIRSFRELTRVQLGFDPDHVLTAKLRAAGSRYDSASAVNRFYDGVLRELAHAPGVVAVGVATSLPTQGSVGSSIRVEGNRVDETRLPDIRYVAVRGDYFDAMRIPLLAGRGYDASDAPAAPKTVIINDAAARRFFPDGNAIGRRIVIGPDPHGAPMTIIGIVGDIREEGLDLPAEPTLFANHRQETWERSVAVVIRTTGDPLRASSLLRHAVRDMDPTLAVREVRTLDDVIGVSLARRRFALGLASSCAALALLLAAVGIYGVLAYAVASRTREFGVRRALGATGRSVLLLVLREGLAWSLLGLGLGIAGALAGGHLLAGMLFGITPLDGSTYASVAVGLLLVVAAACVPPALRAARVDPLTSMQAE